MERSSSTGKQRMDEHSSFQVTSETMDAEKNGRMR